MSNQTDVMNFLAIVTEDMLISFETFSDPVKLFQAHASMDWDIGKMERLVHTAKAILGSGYEEIDISLIRNLTPEGWAYLVEFIPNKFKEDIEPIEPLEIVA